MDLYARLDQVRRLYLRYRRWLAAAAAAGCVLALVHELAPPAPQTTQIVVAARDLSGGRRLAADDLRLTSVSVEHIPSGAATSVDEFSGEQLTGPLRRGEIVTDARVLSADLFGRYGAGLVATPVRLPDAQIVALLQAGDRIDVYAATGAPRSPADRVVSDASVIAVPANGDGQEVGAVVVLALSESDTARLAQASATTQLSISLR